MLQPGCLRVSLAAGALGRHTVEVVFFYVVLYKQNGSVTVHFGTGRKRLGSARFLKVYNFFFLSVDCTFLSLKNYFKRFL